MTQTETQLYIRRAEVALEQSQDNLNLGHRDVAATRAYYAMFYAASALLSSRGVSRRKHTGVQNTFAQYFVKTGLFDREYGQMLANAFRLRLDSDYDITELPGAGETVDVLQDAQRFVEASKAYLQEEGFLS